MGTYDIDIHVLLKQKKRLFVNRRSRPSIDRDVRSEGWYCLGRGDRFTRYSTLELAMAFSNGKYFISEESSLCAKFPPELEKKRSVVYGELNSRNRMQNPPSTKTSTNKPERKRSEQH